MSRQSLLAAAAAFMLPAVPAAAQENPWTAEVTLASEYISKGAGRSDGQPHLGLQVQRRLGSAAYAGLWNGSVRSPLGADAETHLYVGWRPKVAGWSLDLRPMYKVLSNARNDPQTDQWEVRADAARPLLGTRLRVRVEHAFDGYGASKASTWLETNVSRKVGDTGWTVSGALGRREQETGLDYTAWSLAVQRRLVGPLTAELRWVDTDQHDAGREYDSRLVASLTAAWP